MLRRLALVSLFALALAACGEEKDKENAGRACGAAPTAMSGPPTLLPTAFPTPEGLVYVSEKKNGPTSIVTGFKPGDLDTNFEAYKDSLSTGAFTVTKDEKDPADAEVNFSGSSTTGQVKLEQECKDRTTVTITARPD